METRRSLCVSLLAVIIILAPVRSAPLSDDDPCVTYTALDEPWRATNYTAPSPFMLKCDQYKNWNGWYRLLYDGNSIRMPESCVSENRCGTHAPLWLNGAHPRLQDGVVTRTVCGDWAKDCCHYKSPPIQVKACPGNYYVYKFTSPPVCQLAYCADIDSITSSVPTTPPPPSPPSACDYLQCTEDEICEERNGIYNCFCDPSDPIPDPESYSSLITCSNSSASISLSRCLLSEDGFPASVLHLNDPNCTGRVEGGRVEFYFDSDTQQCGSILKSNSTHFIYENSIIGEMDSAGHLISRKRQLNLRFLCVYSINQSLTMDTVINPLESVVNKTLPGGHGSYRMRMNLHQDANFTQVFHGPVDEVLDQTIYVDVQTEWVEDQQFSTVLDDCWATPVNDPSYYVRWELISDGCPNPEDGTVEILRNGISKSSHFSFRVFTFIGNFTAVYLHCSSHQCPEEANDCSMTCDAGPPKSRRSTDFQDRSSVSIGMLTWTDKNTDIRDRRPVRTPRASMHFYFLFYRKSMMGTIKSLCVPLLAIMIIIIAPVRSAPLSDDDPCVTYTALDEPWRATNYTAPSPFMLKCDQYKNWNGWYRLLYDGNSIRMPESCVSENRCGTHAPLWLNGAHPRLQDGVVTRTVCGDWAKDCCHYKSPPIQVKACPGNYYVYKFTSPPACQLAYCADIDSITSSVPTTPPPPSPPSACDYLQCTEDEICEERNGIYNCFCDPSDPIPDPESYSSLITCSNSSASISLSRCLLSEDGFPASVLHLNDPNCTGRVEGGRVEFYFDSDTQQCGSILKSNSTHFIYENSIIGEMDSAGHLISRKRQLNLRFLCVYSINQSLTMDTVINPLESVVSKTLPGGHGSYRMRMTPYQDANFTQVFRGPVDEVLDQTIYVDVQTDEVDDQQFSTVLDDCWATPVNDPSYYVRWNLINDGCPNPEDGTVEVLQNGVSTSSRFSFRVFTFIGNFTAVYLHCSSHQCPEEASDCSMACNSEEHQRSRRSTDHQQSSSVSVGPLTWTDDNTDVLDVLGTKPVRTPKGFHAV
ncbi:uncharacterized protein LOC114787055 [Denticeps clupeoides]|uniref:uncharacterized protein LOC114787055 n=1 Tax=Denticeps clupeoides TaxID=299321 RepID=UPI0010A3DFE5|nr:uncharacterized protein LOC114787055 [Denticeps clupeoides]